MDVEKEKRKGQPQPRNPLWYIGAGFIAGAMFTAVGTSLFDVSQGFNPDASPIPRFIFILGALILFFMSLIAIYTYFYPPRAMLRQKPDASLIVQQLVAGEWEDRITLTPPEIEESIEPDKEKTPPRRSSLGWIAIAAILTSLYSFFLARPPHDKKEIS